MAELGIAAAAAQFLDHSIKLVFKLSWFCSEVRSTPEKLHALQAEVSQQTSLAQNLLSNLGSSSSSTPGIGDLHQIVQDYTGLLTCISETLDKFSKNMNDGHFRRGWNTVRAIRSKEEIQQLCTRLNDNRDLLCVWLGYLNLLTTTQVHDIVSQSRTIVEGHLSRKYVKYPVAIPQSNTELDAVGAIHNGMDNLSSEWQDVGQPIDTFRSLLEEIPRPVRVISQAASQPQPPNESLISDTSSYLRQTCNNIKLSLETVNGDFDVPPGGSLEGCLCRGVSQTSIVEPLSLLRFRWVFKHYHYRHCPRFSDSERSLELLVRIAPPAWLLRQTINLTINVRNWHALRGFSISPSMKGGSRVVNAEVSPSFRAISACREQLNETDFQESAACLGDLLATPKDLFQSRQGSPLDEDVQGSTILYEVLWFYVRHAALAPHSSTSNPPDEYLALVRFLLDHGANPNVLCNRSASDWSWDKPTMDSGTSLDMFAASLEKSITIRIGEIGLIQSAYKGDIGNRLYQTFVDTGAEFSRPIMPIEEIHPVFYRRLFKEELVQYQVFPEQLDQAWELDLSGEGSASGNHIANDVVKALGKRHRRLVNFALACLPESSPWRLELDRDNFKESLAPGIIKELTSVGVDVPRPLQLDGGSVYNGAPHSAKIHLTPTVAQALWNTGFRQVDVDANSSLCPMLRCWYMANFVMALWFQSKGVPITTRDRASGRSGLHYYLEGLCCKGVDPRGRRSERVRGAEQLIEQILDDDAAYHDNCSCLCSPDGCTPLSRLPRLTRRTRLDASGAITAPGLVEMDSVYQAWLDLVGPEKSAQGCLAFVKEILRAVAFEELEGVHACCITVRGIDRTREIRDMSGVRDEWDEDERAEFADKLGRAVYEYGINLEACCCPREGKLLCMLSGTEEWRCDSVAEVP
ncbi:hypothetical protein QBC37DRAFT_452202 [Rhypophila decipiens]|uniref:Fungal N-terminal domain-containing protein n=1 Tax=Rhypophila decipiens TaxID=261697 RepID=A0AAN6XXW3_9PEZI|nr:hypothetical protein QBC37DRAFT_452202 [Rhypophila decipiens]